MKILSWNVKRLGTSLAFHEVGDEINRINPQLCFLSKTKCNASTLNKLKYCLNFYRCSTTNNVGSRGGLCLLWKDEFSMDIRSFSIHHFDANISWRNLSWKFLGVYIQLVVGICAIKSRN